MKLSLKKVYSMIIAGLSLLLFICSFLPNIGIFGLNYNLWKLFEQMDLKALPILLLISYIGIITVYALNFFKILKEKYVGYTNYAIGFICLTYLTLLFSLIKYAHVGIWLGVIFAIGLVVISILWPTASTEPFKGNGAPIVGYDPQTGKPIYAKLMGYDPQTGKPIYAQPAKDEPAKSKDAN